MRFQLLGPLEIRDGEQLVRIGPPAQRVLLAALLLNANRTISVGELLEWVWEAEPPVTAGNLLQCRISRLRRTLGRAAVPAGSDRRLLTRPGGYLLQLAWDELDLWRFERLTEQARQSLASGGIAQAAAELYQALQLWRGPALADVNGGPRLRAEAVRLEELRLAALEDRLDADLGLGRHARLISELQTLVHAYPLSERLYGQLMLALYRAGRRAEALRVYRQARQRLVDEFGLEPGRSLRSLEKAILGDDPTLALPGSGRVTHARVQPVIPRQLPPGSQRFTGRRVLLRELRPLYEREGAAAVTTVLAVAGKPGVGKTTLVLHLAHQLRGRFPDGQLYVDLNGVASHPLDPTDVLSDFLRALGVDGSQIPDGLDARARLYRSRLAVLRALVVLDNAANEHQVRPLLPGGSSCAVLVTSRVRLAGLEVTRNVDLEVLEPVEAIGLLANLAGPTRVAAEPKAARAITASCGYLPLAVRIAGAKLQARSQWSLARLAGRLADERQRLNELTVGDLEVRASLASSYQMLSDQARWTFRLLGLLDAPQFGSWVAAALLDLTASAAEALLEELVDAQLLDYASSPGTQQPRYQFHDLVRLYARERAGLEEAPDRQAAALARAFGAWLALAEAADQRLHRCVPMRVSSGAARWSVGRTTQEALLADPAAWFRIERTSLVAAVRQSQQLGLDDLAWDLASRLDGFFESFSYYDDWAITHAMALEAAERAGDQRGQVRILLSLGELYADRDQYQAALDHFEQAGQALAGLGDPLAEAHTRRSAGVVLRALGHVDKAKAHLEAALVVFIEHDDQPGIAAAAYGLGLIHRDQGRPDQAQAYYETAVEGFERLGDEFNVSMVLCSLGCLHKAAGRPGDARRLLRRGLELARRLGHQPGEAFALCYLGELDVEEGHASTARTMLETARSLCEQINEQFGLGLAWLTLGRLHLATGDLLLAHDCLTAALGIWQELNLPIWQARTLGTIGDAQDRQGCDHQALAVWRQALELFQALGSPEAVQAARRIEELQARQATAGVGGSQHHGASGQPAPATESAS
jgi:DNA-binding SARP family transcriptional activator/DNA polymerase III delta prime subunit